MIQALNMARTTTRLTWLGLTIALAALVLLPHLLPMVGREVYVVRGASMEPNVPLGSIVVVHRLNPADVQVGQVVTFRLPHGTVVTHRVLSVNADGGPSFMTKGDNSASADPEAVPASAIVGDVEYTLPGVGMLIASMSSTAGMVVVLGFLGGLLLASWFLDELLVTVRGSTSRRAVARATN